MTNKQWVLPDTNLLLQSPQILDDYNLIVLSCVLRELEKHKNSPRQELSYQARIATRYIKNRSKLNRSEIRFIANDFNAEKILGAEFESAYFDNQIVAAALTLQTPLITYDVLLQFKAESFDVDVIELDEIVSDDITKYTGIREIFVTTSKQADNEILSKIYTTSTSNPLDMVQHEYLLIWDKDSLRYDFYGKPTYDLIDSLRFDGEKLVKLKYRPTEDRYMGKTKPINIKQRLAFDLMQNKDIVGAMILGGAGSGKDHIIAAHMMQKLNNGEIDKIVFIRNIEPLRDSGQVGFLKGDLIQKMLTWALPLADQIGGLDALDMLIQQGKIEIQHFESIRGRSFKRCGIWVTEMQSMSSYHAKVLVSRIGEDSFMFLNGDTNQTDNDSRKVDSAINTLKKLKGNKMFGLVTLDKTERSDFASLAELL